MTSLAFTGDICFSKYFSESYKDEKLIEDSIVKFLSETDYTVANVEGAVTSAKASADKPLLHANPYGAVEVFKKINGNIWNLGNNHTTDCGIEGIESTLEVARENGCQTFGVGKNIDEAKKPLILNEAGGIGMISLCYEKYKATETTPGVFSWVEEEAVCQLIKEVKTKCRWCVIVSHVGQEFSSMPLPHIRKRYKKFLKFGADLIVGHHPHVVQNYERVGDKMIFYSLGNFIFDTDYQRLQSYTDRGILLKVNFDTERYTWEYLPTRIDRDNNRVCVGKTPEIFTEINSRKYNLLWPLAARVLCKNEKKKYAYTKKHMAGYSWLDWLFKWELKNMKNPQGRYTMLGRALANFNLWRLCDKKLVDYIREKEVDCDDM